MINVHWLFLKPFIVFNDENKLRKKYADCIKYYVFNCLGILMFFKINLKGILCICMYVF